MVREVTSFGRSGLADWLVQRVSGVVLLAYTLVVAGYLIGSTDLDYAQWNGFFDATWMRVFSTAALLSIVAHAWIGMWSVATDYMTERLMGSKGTALRLLFQAGCAVLLFVYLVWGLQILWS